MMNHRCSPVAGQSSQPTGQMLSAGQALAAHPALNHSSLQCLSAPARHRDACTCAEKESRHRRPVAAWLSPHGAGASAACMCLQKLFTPEPYGQPDATHLVHDGPGRPALPWWHRSRPVQVSMQLERAFGLTRICRGAVNQGQCAGVHPAGARLWARLHGTPRHLPQQGMSRSGRGVELSLHCGVWTA